MTLGIVLLYGPRRGVFLMSEVHLYTLLHLQRLTKGLVGCAFFADTVDYVVFVDPRFRGVT